MVSATAAVVGGSLASGAISAFGAGKASKQQREAAEEAARIQARATEKSIGAQERAFEAMRAETSPFRQMGISALYRLGGAFGLPGFDEAGYQKKKALLQKLKARRDAGDDPGNLSDRIGQLSRELDVLSGQRRLAGQVEGAQYDVTQSPGYQFRLGEGEKALDRFQAASGHRLGGRALKEAQRYAQDYASGEYGNYLDRLYRLSGMGSSAVGATTQAGMQTAGNIGQAYTQGAAQQANALMSAGAAQAGGTIGQTQAATDAFGNIGNYLMLEKFMGGAGTNPVPGSTS